MENRIAAIEKEIKGINCQLSDHGKVSAVISTELRGMHGVLKDLASNQKELIALRADTNNLVAQCDKKHEKIDADFNESFSRLRAVESEKISKDDLEKCKKDVLCQSTKAIGSVKDDVAGLLRNQRLGIISILTVIIGTAAKKIFWP